MLNLMLFMLDSGNAVLLQPPSGDRARWTT